MTEIVEMGTISSRGQIAIPADIRRALDLEEGQKIMFFLEDDTLLMKKVNPKTFEELTRPLRKAKKKISEKQVVSLIHKMRRK